MKIALGADHGGVNLKEAVIKAVKESGNEVVDFGTFSEESVDYPVYAEKAARAVQSGECELGVLLCGTGIGMSIAANKLKGIRCGHVTNVFSAAATREHNNANVISMGGRITTPEEAYEITKAFLSASYAGGRHQKRIDYITKLEEK